MPANRTRAPRFSQEKAAAFKEYKNSPQRRRECREPKAPRPQAHLDDSWEPPDVGARLRATRQAQCQRIARERHAFPRRRLLPSKNISINRRERRERRAPKMPRPQADLDDSWEPPDVGARLRATRQAQCQRIARERHAFPRRKATGHYLARLLTRPRHRRNRPTKRP
jgi:hypothetical protein